MQLYETNQVAKKSHYTPSMELQTTSILFNSATGEINCPNDVRVTSVSKTLFGKNLSVRYNDIEERVEYLRLAELDYIEFIPGSKVASSTPTPFPPTRQPLGNQQLKLSQHKIHAAAAGDDSNSQLGAENLLEGLELFSGKTNLKNEIAILKSYSITQQVVKDLDLGISYFKHGKIQTSSLFGNSHLPFLVEIDSTHLQLCSKNFFVTLLNDNQAYTNSTFFE